MSVVPTRSAKFSRLTSAGSGFGSRENACDGVSAIFITHSTG